MAFSLIQTIFSFIYYLSAIRKCTASVLHHDEECLALFEFKQSMILPPYASFDRKIPSNALDHYYNCCLWDGVVCSNKGHVIGLDLSQSSLHGPIKSNSSLFNLVHLQMLNLSMNDFVESQIPTEMARLKHLRSLDLSSSNFSGQILNEISHLMQLTVLDLSWNSLKVQSPGLEYLLQNLTSLKELHLSGVDISSFVPPFLSNFSSLRLIDLQDCQLHGEFPYKIFHLPKLKFLSIAENPNLTGSLPEFQNTTLLLEYLNLYATSFARSIPESISELNHLAFLSLHASYFSGCIPHSLFNMTQLTDLALGQHELMGLLPSMPKRLSNPVGLEVCEKGRLHDWVSKLTNLESLVLIRINIYDEMLPSLANLTKLSKVQMRKTGIFGRIPSSFMNLTQLRILDIRGNQLQGQISTSFSNFKSLEYLFLENNYFSGIVELNTFVGLTKLEALSLGNNKISFVATNFTNATHVPELKYLGLSSCNLREFPIFLRFQKKIKSLSLQNNKIEGLVPEWFVNNTKETLQFLDLSYNSITGFHQRPHFLPMVRLEEFNMEFNQLRGRLPIPQLTTVIYDVSNNNLIGEIPPLICDVKSLRVLDLSSNNMTGTLPPCLGNFSKLLEVLDLKRNKFHGPMMSTFTHGSLLKSIDLSENQFTGRLSKSLANCTNLEFLALGRNSFEDAFPFWLGNLANLQVLILGSNKLFGSIQGLATIGSPFLKLRIIDLSNNGFSGQLPQKLFQTWNAMKSSSVGNSSILAIDVYINPRSRVQVPYSMTLINKGFKREYQQIPNIFTVIDLSSNKFEGKIPESIQDLLGLQSVNLSNNYLTGRVLPSLGNLKNLESLDLSQNKLTGEIPQELLQLGFLSFFNVSSNLLHGRIPQGKQFSTFDNNSYKGNPGLFGTPLSKECQILTTPTLPPTNNYEYESFLPSDKIDWILIFLGFGSGLINGIILGHWLIGQDKRVRPLWKLYGI